MINCYRKYCILFILFIFSCFSVNAQTFSVSEIDASAFPKIQCSFMALDQNGISYNNIQKTDLTIFDRGISVTPSINIDCADDPNVSVELVLDQSSSMNFPAEDPRWDWVLEGATSFINTLNFTSGTQVGIISFARDAHMVCPFTRTKSELIDSLHNIIVNGGTRYGPAFLDAANGAIPLLRNYTSPNIRRIIVFLTDGDPDASDETPTNTIINEALGANIQVYAITVSMPMNDDLAKISSMTGGKSYAVFNKSELNNIYKLIVGDIQEKQICKLSWIAPYGCSDADRQRKVDINFRNINQIETEYTAPVSSLSGLECPSYLFLGNPEVNAYSDADITLKAFGTDYTLTSANIDPDTYFSVVNWNVGGNSVNPPFVIKNGESQTIRVRYSTGATKAERQAKLILNGNLCSYDLDLYGGYTRLLLVSPEGGEVFSLCDTVDIKWAGVDKTENVDIYYSTDNSNWNLIKSKATGLEYKWIPPSDIAQCFIKVSLTPAYEYKWVNSAGGIQDDIGSALTLNADCSDIYAVGSFKGTAMFDNTALTAKNDRDMFIVKYSADGQLLWAKSAGSPLCDSAASVCVDSSGSIYAVGTCYQNMQFGNMTPNITVNNVPYCFIVKYSPDGTISGVNVDIGANAQYTNFSAWGKEIICSSDGNIIVSGGFSGKLYQYPIDLEGNAYFVATFDNNLNLISVLKTNSFYSTKNNSFCYTAGDVQYKIGTYTDSKTFNTTKITSAGGSDIYLYKYAPKTSSSDQNNKAFVVTKPNLAFSQNSINLGSCRMKLMIDTVVNSLLKNTGNLQAEITDATIEGDPDFKLISNLKSSVIQPGESVPIELSFTPHAASVKTANLKISYHCNSDIILPLTATGVCFGNAIDSIDMGTIVVNKLKDSTFYDIFINTNYDTLTVYPIIEGSSDFSLDLNHPVLLNPGDSLVLKITFHPTSLGTKTAKINYQLSPMCDSVYSYLTGESVLSTIKTSNYDFGRKRVLSNNSGSFNIINSTDFSVNVNNVKFEDDNYAKSAGFGISNISLPIAIDSNKTIAIPITFSPQNELNYSTNILIYIDGNDTPYKVKIAGKGFLPKIEAVWACAEPTKVGGQSTANLTIFSKDSISDLKLISADFATSNGEYTWTNGKPQNITIAAGASQVFGAVFKPSATGIRNNSINIISDATTGPDVNPQITKSIDVGCEGTGVDFTKNIDYGTLLPCSKLTLPFTIKNMSANSNLTIDSYSISGIDKGYFFVDMPNKLVVKANDSVKINITFEPKELKDYNVKITFANDQDFDIFCTLTGKSEDIKFYTDKDAFESQPGKDFEFSIFAKVPNVNDKVAEPYKYDFDVMYNSTMLKYVENSLQSNVIGLTWQTPSAIAGGTNISAEGKIPSNFNNKIVTVKFDTYLGDTVSTDIKVLPQVNECLKDTLNLAKYAIDGVCFLSGRLVTTSAEAYAMQAPIPNPAGNITKIKFSAAFDSHAVMEIYDSFGNLTTTILNQNINKGAYEIDLNVEQFCSGVYFVRYRCGSFSHTERLMISK